MDKRQALELLVQSALRGQSKGIFTLEEAAMILQAIKVFEPKNEETAPLPVAEPNQE